MFNRFRDNKSGSVMMVVALIATIVVLVLGVYILASFTTSLPNLAAGAGNTTATALINAGWSAFGLAVIIPMIVVASAIIGYIVKGFGGGQR
jgi:amino acid transporter